MTRTWYKLIFHKITLNFGLFSRILISDFQERVCAMCHNSLKQEMDKYIRSEGFTQLDRASVRMILSSLETFRQNTRKEILHSFIRTRKLNGCRFRSMFWWALCLIRLWNFVFSYWFEDHQMVQEYLRPYVESVEFQNELYFNCWTSFREKNFQWGRKVIKIFYEFVELIKCVWYEW